MKREDVLSREIVTAAIDVHGNPGPGLLESVYEGCLCSEFREREIACERQVRLPARYKGKCLDCGYRLDLVVDRLVILELKAVNRLEPISQAQLLTLSQVVRIKVGFSVKFQCSVNEGWNQACC